MDQIDTNTKGSVVGKKIICTNCHIQFGDIVNYKLHLASEFHIYNTKRRMVNLAPISEDVFELKKQQLESANASAITDMHFKCMACNKGFKSQQQLDEHKKSKKHKRSEKEYLIQNKDMSSSDIFRSISHSQASIADKSDSVNANMLGELNEPEIKRLDDVPEDKKEVEHRPTALESTRCCLFCNKMFDGVKKCVDHMRISHGFLILDVDCLVDLKGLLAYMAERIQLGNLCLFCSKQFRDPRRCQQHMIDKSHCMMNMEDEEEYLDFYDFSKTYIDHPLLINNGVKAIEPEVKEEKKPKKAAKQEDEGSWEDCDAKSLGSKEDDGEWEELDSDKDSDDFEVVDTPSSTQSFQIIDGVQVPTSTTDGFEIGTGTSVASNFKMREAQGDGRTKEEVFLGLNIKKAELLPSGEVRLGNGKTIGTRRWNYLYKQKLKLPDERESVVIGKLMAEAKKLKMIADGGVSGQLLARQQQAGFLAKEDFKMKKLAQKIENKAFMKLGISGTTTMQKHFKDPTGFLQ